MILFLEDWKKYPNAIIDLRTTNTSFLELASKYKQMGIKNHAFFLALHNPLLQGIDAHDPDLDQDTKIAIAEECKINFWYFLREVARAPAQSGAEARKVRANRGNICLFWVMHNHITMCLEQIRQTGKSFNTDLINRWFLNVRCKNTTINLLTKDNKVRVSNLERLREIEKAFPDYLQLTIERGLEKDIFNTEALTVKALGNKLQSHVPQRNQLDATKQGRGLTSPIFHIDEVPFIANIEYSLPAALAAGGAIRDIARENNEPYCTVLTTTAGRLDEPSGIFTHNLFQEAAPWSETFFDLKDIEELTEVVRKQSSGDVLRIYAKFSHRQLGYSDEWLKGKIEEAIATGDAARMDYFGEWIIGNARNPLPTKIIERIKASEHGDFYPEISEEGYMVKWFIPEHKIDDLKNHSCLVLGLDASDAVGKDDIALILRDGYTGETLAEGSFNETNLVLFAGWLFTWFLRFPNIIWIPERRSSAVSMIDFVTEKMLMHQINPFLRIFNWVVNDREEHPERFNEVIARKVPSRETVTKYKKLFGYATSGSGRTSRDFLYGSVLLSAAKYTGHVAHGPKLIGQISGLVERNGRIDHVSGGHDDLVIAWLMSHWLLLHGKNLDVYGVKKRDILREVALEAEEASGITQETKYFQKRDAMISDKINELVAAMESSRSKLQQAMIEKRIIMLSKKLSGTTQGLSMDSVLEQLTKLKDALKTSKQRR